MAVQTNNTFPKHVIKVYFKHVISQEVDSCTHSTVGTPAIYIPGLTFYSGRTSDINTCFICIFTCLLTCSLLVSWFLVFAFACTHIERGCLELRQGLPGASKKGMDVSMRLSRVAVFNRSRVYLFPLVMYSFKPSPSFSLSPLDGLY